MHPRTRAIAFLALGVAVLAGLLAYVGPSRVLEAVREASPIHLLLAFLAYCAFFIFRGVRWRMLFAHSAPDVRLSSTTSISAIGWLANSILPFKSGDVLRAALLARKEKVGLATSAATVGLERVLDLLGLAVIAAAGLLLLPHAAELPPGLEKALAIVWVLPLAVLVVLAILVRWREATVRLAARIMRPLGKIGAKLVAFGDTVLAGLGALARRPKLLAKLVPLTLAVSLTQALVFTFLVVAFLRSPPLVLAFAGSAVFLLSFVVSITPGNVGTYEAAFAAIFVGLGVAPEIAVPAAVLTHVVTTLTVAVLGGVGLYVLGIQKKDAPWRPTRAPEKGALP